MIGRGGGGRFFANKAQQNVIGISPRRGAHVLALVIAQLCRLAKRARRREYRPRDIGRRSGSRRQRPTPRARQQRRSAVDDFDRAVAAVRYGGQNGQAAGNLRGGRRRGEREIALFGPRIRRQREWRRNQAAAQRRLGDHGRKRRRLAMDKARRARPFIKFRPQTGRRFRRFDDEREGAGGAPWIRRVGAADP